MANLIDVVCRGNHRLTYFLNPGETHAMADQRLTSRLDDFIHNSFAKKRMRKCLKRFPAAKVNVPFWDKLGIVRHLSAHPNLVKWANTYTSAFLAAEDKSGTVTNVHGDRYKIMWYIYYARNGSSFMPKLNHEIIRSYQDDLKERLTRMYLDFKRMRHKFHPSKQGNSMTVEDMKALFITAYTALMMSAVLSYVFETTTERLKCSLYCVEGCVCTVLGKA